MSRFVEIAVNVPRVSGVFHYHASPEVESRLKPGQMVLVPFGRQVVQGIVLRLVAEADVPETKAIHSIIMEEPALTSAQLSLAERMAEDSLAPLAACIGIMLPPGVGQIADTEYSLVIAKQLVKTELSEAQMRVLNVLVKRGPLRGRQLDRALPNSHWRNSVAALKKKGYLQTQPTLPLPKAKIKKARTARLIANVNLETISLEQLGRQTGVQNRRMRVLEVLKQEAAALEMAWIYAESRANRSDLIYLEKHGFVEFGEKESIRDPLLDRVPSGLPAPELTPDQQVVWDVVTKEIKRSTQDQSAKSILLHGVTGSGKTEIYLRAVADTLKQGRQALILVPEIALTPQTSQRFLDRFPGQVGVLHSQLSSGERFDTWRRTRDGKISVIVGPRSALFAPLPNVGLIVLDESHDDSFYEAGKSPHYHARQTALRYAEISKALCIFGSATPDIVTRFQADQDRHTLLKLPRRIVTRKDAPPSENGELPPVEIVDMRTELKSGNRSIFSRALQDSLKLVLDRDEQAILFLNRRGKSTYVFCRNCGHTMTCPNCERGLTQHGAHELGQNTGGHDMLLCHHCGHSEGMPVLCPNCGDERIRQYGTGTQNVVTQLERLFPGVRSLRWDRESTRRKNAHQQILDAFGAGEANILVGTQMLAKGLDLPRITLVGVVLADVGLHMPDIRATERVFQVLTQVAGRAGRSELGGKVLLQSFHPDHYVLQAAAQHDYSSFYEQELRERRRLRYPPFSNLVRLLFKDPNEQKCRENAQAMAAQLIRMIKQQGRRNTDIIGPAPAFYSRLNKEYRWQIVLRGPDPQSMLKGIKLVGWQTEVNPPSLL
jgi:primosomal protein N' (replication factor Y)